MMVQDEVTNYVLEKINDFPQISVEDIENWLQEDPNANKKIEKFRNDLSVKECHEVPKSHFNVQPEFGAEVQFSGTFYNTQIGNIVAEYEKYNSILPEDLNSENLDQILSFADSRAVEDKNLSTCPEQTYGIDSHGNLIKDAAKTINEIISNNYFENIQVQNNIQIPNTEQLQFKKSTSTAEKHFLTDFSTIVPASIIESSSIKTLSNNDHNNSDIYTNFNNHNIHNCTAKNSLEHHYVETNPNNYNLENKGIKLIIKKNKPVYSIYTKGQLTGGKNTYNDILSSNQISNSFVDSKNITIEQDRSNPKFHLEVVTKALATVDITDDVLKVTRTEDNQKLWTCHMPNCKSMYRKLCQIKEHLLTHFGLKPFKCDFKNCKWAFSSLFKLKRHQKSHEKVKEYICPEPTCKRQFSTANNLAIHKKIHQRVNKFHCPVPDCSTSFPMQKALDKHMRNDHNEQFAPIVCLYPGCNKRFCGNSAFMSHQRVHNYSYEDVTCSWPGCGKVFDIPSRLKYHMISHTGIKTYQCPYCEAGFFTASKLVRHEKTHKDERQFVCNVLGCKKSFLRMEHLRQHYLTHNTDREKYKCDYCHCTFMSKASIHTHVKKHLNGHFEKLKKPQKRHTEKNFTIEKDKDQYHCARTKPFRCPNKKSKSKLISSEMKQSSIDQESNNIVKKMKKIESKTRKVKRSFSEKENVAPSSDYLHTTSPSYQEENQDVASTAFGEDYVNLSFDNLENNFLNEELPPLFTHENFEVPECQLFNDSMDGNNIQDILEL